MKLSSDLTSRFGRGFSVDNLEQMRSFYLLYPPEKISETLSRKSDTTFVEKEKSESLIRKFTIEQLSEIFPLSWTHYIHLMRRIDNQEAREFYELEALRNSLSVRQFDWKDGEAINDHA